MTELDFIPGLQAEHASLVRKPPLSRAAHKIPGGEKEGRVCLLPSPPPGKTQRLWQLLFTENLLDLANLSLDFSNDLFNRPGNLQLGIVAQFPGDLLDLPFDFVKCPFRLVPVARFHGLLLCSVRMNVDNQHDLFVSGLELLDGHQVVEVPCTVDVIGEFADQVLFRNIFSLAADGDDAIFRRDRGVKSAG